MYDEERIGTIGEIRMFAGNYAPEGWLLCDGRLLDVRQYHPLYAMLGATYGGDGHLTFALPDLRGSLPLGATKSPGEVSKPETIVLSDGEGEIITKLGETTLAINFIICTEGSFPKPWNG